MESIEACDDCEKARDGPAFRIRALSIELIYFVSTLSKAFPLPVRFRLREDGRDTSSTSMPTSAAKIRVGTDGAGCAEAWE